MIECAPYKLMFDTLGFPVAIEAWDNTASLPLHLGRSAEYWKGEIYGIPFILALLRPNATLPDCKRIHKGISAVTGLPTVIGAALDARQRHALVAQSIPFVVPGAQVHMPFVGIGHIARGQARRTSTSSADSRLSAKAQAAAIWAAQYTENTVALGTLHTQLNMYASDASRAVFELVERGIAEKHRRGRAVYYSLIGGVEHLLNTHLHLFSSPVVGSILTLRAPELESLSLSGESALAAISALSPPPIETRAVLRSQARALPIRQVLDGEYPNHQVMRIELWTYSPILLRATQSQSAPIALALSLAGVNDERVMYALKELFGKDYPWTNATPH